MTATTPQVALAIRNVLVATDFSPCSERALLHAVAAAHHFGSALHLVHVVQPGLFSFVPPEAYLGSAEAVSRAMDLARSETRALLDRVLLRTHCQDLTHHSYIQTGAVGDVLRAIIAREHIDLAVVGTHGRTGLRKLVLGSVAEDVFRYASCPVLTVGPQSWQSDPQAVRLKHVLFPTDFSPDSARALRFTMAITADFAAKLTLLHVVERLDGEAAHDRPRIVSALEQRMREMVADARAMAPGVDFQVVFGDVADMIVETAAHLGVDLVAFGLKAPDTPVDRLPWMHAYKVACQVECPVLSLRGPSARWPTD